MLLNIPPQKTLLRRHLTTNFNVLIGPEAQQDKREIVESTAYTALTTTAKVRVGYREAMQTLEILLEFLVGNLKASNLLGSNLVFHVNYLRVSFTERSVGVLLK